jgi:transaldolase
MNHSLQALSDAGVSVWLDDLSRQRLRTGNLADLMRDKDVRGVTTNPSIFQHALATGDAYEAQLRDLALRGCDLGEAVRALQAYDVRWGCDVLRPVFDRTAGVDGRVSYEVDPRLAHDSDRTVAEAEALWWLVDRPNLYIKIPATAEGPDAITRTLARGISVNVTLIFSLGRYEQVMQAFMAGLEAAQQNGHDLAGISSVASFFVSRVDTEVDRRLEAMTAPVELRGRAAIANARLAYQRHQQVFASERWQALQRAGATPQRPLWASTGVKNPVYDDTRYVVELVAPGTVSTMPEDTLDAVLDHGVVRADTVTSAYGDARETLDELAAAGIDYDDVVDQLEFEGVRKFEDAWSQLLGSVAANLAAPAPSEGPRNGPRLVKKATVA